MTGPTYLVPLEHLVGILGDDLDAFVARRHGAGRRKLADGLELLASAIVLRNRTTLASAAERLELAAAIVDQLGEHADPHLAAAITTARQLAAVVKLDKDPT